MSEEEDDEIQEALDAVHAGEATLSDVLSLANASLLPKEVDDAIDAKYAMDGDVANGGLDQVAWNQGADAAREYAKAFRGVGAIENADVLDRLAVALGDYEAKHSKEEIAENPVKHFLAYRKSVSGPEFGIPEPGDELAEVLVEYVISRASELPKTMKRQ
jgi:hypothetical protein